MILILATSRKTQGGITSVVKSHETGEQWKQFHCTWIAMHRGGGKKWRKLLYWASGLLRYILLLPFADIVHMHLSHARSIARKKQCMKLAKLFGKKTIIHFHPPGPQVFDNEAWHTSFEYLFTNADKVLVLSDQWKRWLKEYFNIEDNVQVLYNPCPTARRDESIERRKQILFAGRVEERKGVDVLLKAFARIAADCRDWTLVFAGHGELNEAKQLASSLGIDSQVRFLGWVSGTDKDRAFSEASIYCLPSRGEGFPMGVLDAWSYELPCVVTPVGGIPDIVENGKQGVIVPIGDDEALAEALKHLMHDEALRQEIVNNTQVFVNETFEAQHINMQLAEIYKSLL